MVFVTAPDIKVARSLARSALNAKLIACANLVQKIESHYRWRGKIEVSPEVLMIMKTAKTKVAGLEKLILGRHPYDTPEFLVVPIKAGSKRYLDWLADSI